MENYNEQAILFLEKTNTKFEIKFLENSFHFEDDTETRDIYEVTLTKDGRQYTFNFGQSVFNSGFYLNYGNRKISLNREWLKLSKSDLQKNIKRNVVFDFQPHTDKINYPIVPTEYDVLACLTKYDPETFEDFCDNYGYNSDSIKANNIYHLVVEEWKNVCMLWSSSEVEELAEIS